MSYSEWRSEMRKIAREAVLNDTEMLEQALEFIVDTENGDGFRSFLQYAVKERAYRDEVAYDDRKLYCLKMPDGTIDPRFVVCEHCGTEHKFALEKTAGPEVLRDWKDCTDRVREFPCSVCGYPKKEYEVEVVRIGYGHCAIRLRAWHDQDAAETALEVAGNYLYREVDADYEVNSVEVIS